MSIDRATIDPTRLPRVSGYPRTVTHDDAARMKLSPGEWYEVALKTKTPSNASSMAGTLKRSLPGWYGGRWETLCRSATLYCRFLGDS